MIRLFLMIFMAVSLNLCHGQIKESFKALDVHTLSKEAPTGIVYFSTDNGLNWVNSSKGLPAQVSIGLGGIATSNQYLGLATKEFGVYIYNFENTELTKKCIPTVSCFELCPR